MLNLRKKKKGITDLRLLDIYNLAYEQNISISYMPLKDTVSLSCPLGFIVMDVDKLSDSKEELVCLSHEIGHCETGSFYNIHSPLDIRQKHEARADRWAIKKLIPKDELDEAVKCGIVEMWELAEYFGVPEKFISKACTYYQTQA